jgi:8-oxo-dGTP diphosphatase
VTDCPGRAPQPGLADDRAAAGHGGYRHRTVQPGADRPALDRIRDRPASRQLPGSAHRSREVRPCPFAGGHVQPGETLAEAAVREVHEETGIDAEVITGPLPAYGTVTVHPSPFLTIEATAADPVSGPHQHIDALFILRAASAQIGQLDRREVTGARWVSPDQMRELNVPPELPGITEAAIAWAARQADQPRLPARPDR